VHELHITESLLKTALEQARAANASKVLRLNIALGDGSGYTEDSIRFYFDMLRKDSLAAEADITFRHIGTQMRCRDCGATSSAQDPTWVCPQCHSMRGELLCGGECYLESIEVE